MFWMTADGKYYEADAKLNPTDFYVERRPSRDAVFVDGTWMINRRQMRMDVCPAYTEDDYPRHEAPRRRSEDIQPVQVRVQKDAQSDTTLTKDTKLLFGLKDIFVVGAFIATAAISWQDTNQRIVKLETDERVVETNKNVKHLDTELRALEKTLKNEHSRLEKQIHDVSSELERLYLIRGNAKKDTK